ncbi:hypothetical protein CW304_03095 [Bacillus sp. UFRGS-B20]|nr:hypothetical protein CW304_03095 [Bacillus sp. UFRGS-B20]
MATFTSPRGNGFALKQQWVERKIHRNSNTGATARTCNNQLCPSCLQQFHCNKVRNVEIAGLMPSYPIFKKANNTTHITNPGKQYVKRVR